VLDHTEEQEVEVEVHILDIVHTMAMVEVEVEVEVWVDREPVEELEDITVYLELLVEHLEPEVPDIHQTMLMEVEVEVGVN